MSMMRIENTQGMTLNGVGDTLIELACDGDRHLFRSSLMVDPTGVVTWVDFS